MSGNHGTITTSTVPNPSNSTPLNPKIDALIAQAKPPGPLSDPSPDPQSGQRLSFINSAQFHGTSYPLDWLIPGILVRGQLAIFGGPRKCMKTSILLDLALTLGARIDAVFLDHFDRAKQVRVGVMSGESGDAVLQETARRIAASKTVNLSASSVHWCFELPRLSSPKDLALLGTRISDLALDVIIIDPLYACLFGVTDDASGASNLFKMGPLLAEVSRTCLEAGATPILAHHARKHRSPDERREPLDLEDLSFAGIQEFARQWLLVSRRADFVPGTGLHQLWLNVGGSAGHSGLWGVDINENPYHEVDDRWWNVSVMSAEEARAASVVAKQDHKQQVQASKVSADAKRVLDFLEDHPTGETRSVIKEALNISGTRLIAVVSQLQASGELVDTSIDKNGKSWSALRLAP